MAGERVTTLHRVRRDRDVTQMAVAVALGVSQGQVWRWEYGYARPTAAQVARLAQVYRVPVEVIVAAVERGREVGDGEPAGAGE